MKAIDCDSRISCKYIDYETIGNVEFFKFNKNAVFGVKVIESKISFSKFLALKFGYV
jgi:hypothetical protein